MTEQAQQYRFPVQLSDTDQVAFRERGLKSGLVSFVTTTKPENPTKGMTTDTFCHQLAICGCERMACRSAGAGAVSRHLGVGGRGGAGLCRGAGGFGGAERGGGFLSRNVTKAALP